MADEENVHQDSQLSFLGRASPAASTRPADAANLAVGRRAANLRGINGEYLLQLAEPFAPELNPNAGEAADGLSFSGPSESNGSLASPASAATLSSGTTAAPHREHFARALVVGPSGSGKTTFRQCIAQVVRLGQKPIAQPSSVASSSTYHFNVSASSTRPAEKLFIDVVDTGPSQLSGLLRFYRPADLVVLTWSLATVKQTRKRTGLLSGTVETAVFHPREVQELATYIRDLTVLLPGVPLVVVGTHKDVLSEKATASIEKVVQTLEGHVLEAIDAAARGETPHVRSATTSATASPTRSEQHATPGASPDRSAPPRSDVAGTRLVPPLLLGTYAVSSEDGKAIGASGGHVTSINTMWRTVCESILKGARGRGMAQVAATAHLHYFDSASQLTDLVDRVRKFFNCLRTEHGIVLLGVHHLAQTLFAFGAPSKRVVDAVLLLLQHRGDLLVLRRTAEHPKQVLLLPHLPSFILAAVHDVANGMKSAIEERRSKLVPIKECIDADTSKELTRGLLKGSVLRHMVACIPSDVAQDRTLIFVRVARLMGFAFRLGGDSREKPVSRQLYPSTDASAKETRPVEGNSFFNENIVSSSDKYIVPSLITSVAAPTTISTLRREVESGRTHTCARTVHVLTAPAGFFPMLQCEVGDVIAQRTHVTRTSIWLSEASNRAFIHADRDPSEMPCEVTLNVVFFAATGADSVRELALFVSRVMSRVSATLHASNVANQATVTLGSELFGCRNDNATALSCSAASEDDSVAALLRLDLCVVPLCTS